MAKKTLHPELDALIPHQGAWELFYKSMDCARADRALSSAMRRVLLAMQSGMPGHPALNKYWTPVAMKHSKCGTRDTEPRGVAKEVMIAASRVLGNPLN